MIAEVRRARAQHGVGRSIEHESVSFAQFADALLNAIKRLDVDRLVAVVGDYEVPAVFRLGLGDLEALLREVGNQDGTISFSTDSFDAYLCIDPPNPNHVAGESLVSGAGAVTKVLDEYWRRRPGGIEFRGN